MSLQDEINKLKAEKQALIEEFASPPGDQSSAQTIYNHISQLVPDALAQLAHLLNHSDSESIRFSSTKYVLDIARNPDDPNNPDSALTKLINELRKPTPASS